MVSVVLMLCLASGITAQSPSEDKTFHLPALLKYKIDGTKLIGTKLGTKLMVSCVLLQVYSFFVFLLCRFSRGWSSKYSTRWSPNIAYIYNVIVIVMDPSFNHDIVCVCVS